MISLIVAIAENGVIGKQGKIPWNLPSELAYFRRTTEGHPIIMGRKTYESIGHPLPRRYNIVITTQKSYSAGGCTVVHSIEEAIDEAKKSPGNDEIFIIGGAEIYKLAMPLAGRIYLTKIHADVKGDKFFEYDLKDWKELSCKIQNADKQNKYSYDMLVLDRK